MTSTQAEPHIIDDGHLVLSIGVLSIGVWQVLSIGVWHEY